MSILVDRNTRLLVQGITGKEGSYHAARCREYGTNLVAGVTPGKGGQVFDGDVPVYDTVERAVDETGANASLIFVPPPFRRRRHRRVGRRRNPRHRDHNRRGAGKGLRQRRALSSRQGRHRHRAELPRHHLTRRDSARWASCRALCTCRVGSESSRAAGR